MNQQMSYRLIIFILGLSGAFILLSTNSSVGGAIQPAFLKVVVLVNNTGGGTAQPSDLKVNIGSAGGSAYQKVDPYMYDGSTNGTISSAVQGVYLVDLGNNIIKGEPYSLDFSGDCVAKSLASGEVRLQPGDKKTCIVTASYIKFD